MLRATTTAAALLFSLALLPACSEDILADDFGGDDVSEFGDDDGEGAESGGEGDGRGCSGSSSFASNDPGCSGDGDGDGDGDGGRGDGGVCQPHETDLIAAQHDDTGSIYVANDDDSLSLSIETAAGYLLSEVHVYVGTGPIPTNNGGAVAPGQFPYTQEFMLPQAGYELELSLDDLGVGCDDSLNVAVHAVVISIQDGQLVYEETAWGFGPEEFRSSWGWGFDYAICCEPEPEVPEFEGCTLTRGYWQTHNSEAEIPTLQQPWPIAETTELCGQTWLENLETEPEGDAFYILSAQWIAAKLNVANGAEAPVEVESALAAADALLEGCEISEEDREFAVALSELLDAFNNGEVGPAHCE